MSKCSATSNGTNHIQPSPEFRPRLVTIFQSNFWQCGLNAQVLRMDQKIPSAKVAIGFPLHAIHERKIQIEEIEPTNLTSNLGDIHSCG